MGLQLQQSLCLVAAGVTPVNPLVDIHAHHFPVGLPDLATKLGDQRWPSLIVDDDPRIMLGDTVFRKVRPSCFDVVARVGELEASGIDQQVISPVPITLVDWAEPVDALRFLALQNDLLAAAASESGGRLIALGAVPLQDTRRAIAEMRRTRHELGMAGIEISAMVDGRELDDPSFEPFWAAAAAEEVSIFIHPAHQRTAIRRSGQPFEFGVGMLTDTALAASALVFGGVLERHPDLRIALAHGCGTFPWAFPRLRYMAALRSPDIGPLLDSLVRRLWVDALVFDPAHLDLLIRRFGDGHVMYGTDHPFLPEGFDGPLKVLSGAGLRRDVAGCHGANALRFLGVGPSAC